MIDPHTQTYEFGEFRLDVMKRQLVRQGEIVPLYSKAFDLLLVLVQQGGGLLTKDELLEAVWPGQILEEANLTVTMSAVRKALGEKARQPHYIVNIPGRGYRFLAGVRDEAGAMVIERQTIARITVEEETTDDEIDAVGAPANFIASGEPEPAPGVGQLERKQLAPTPQSSRRVFKLRVIMVALLALSAVIVVAAIYVVLKARQARATAARFTQIKVTQITNSGQVGNVAISPDGKFFAFTVSDRGNRLKVGQMNGETPIELLPPSDAIYRGLEYATDGSSLFYARQDHGQTSPALYRISVLGGAPVKLHDNIDGYFAMAPDDRHVAFVRADDAGKTRSLIVLSLDGGNETALATLPVERNLNPRSVAWSPDGSTIAVSASRDLNDPTETIFLAQTANGRLTALAPKWRDISRVVWLKDGSGLLTIAAAPELHETPQVWFVDYPRGEAHRITNDLGIYDIGLSVGLDSKSFLLVQQRQISNLWVGPADDLSKAKQLTFQSFSPSFGNFVLDWLPDNRIVYATSLGRGPSLWSMDPDGQNTKEITPPGYGDQYPSTTGDGRFIVFASSRSGADEVWRADIDGGNAKQLTTCGKNDSPSVSRDGKWVVYVSGCDGVGALWRVPFEGGQPLRLTDRAVLSPRVSPDSKWIACGYKSEANKWQLAVVPIEGGPPARLFDVATRANFNGAQRWTPDGKAITYRDWLQGLWRQAVEGGSPQRIPGLPEEKIYGYDWSRNGKLFAQTRGVEIRDVVLISNSN